MAAPSKLLLSFLTLKEPSSRYQMGTVILNLHLQNALSSIDVGIAAISVEISQVEFRSKTFQNSPSRGVFCWDLQLVAGNEDGVAEVRILSSPPSELGPEFGLGPEGIIAWPQLIERVDEDSSAEAEHMRPHWSVIRLTNLTDWVRTHLHQSSKPIFENALIAQTRGSDSWVDLGILSSPHP